MLDVRSQNLIGGRWVDPVGGAWAAVGDPATGEVLAKVASSSGADVDEAVRAARAAAPVWRDCPPAERAAALFAIASAMDGHRDRLAALESANVGKPMPLARAEVGEAVDALRFFAGAARTDDGLAAQSHRRGTTSLVRHEPMGVVGLVTAWNFPLMGAIWKLGAALAAGNACVLKPSEQTPLTTLALAEIAAPLLPPGVLNVVVGDGDPVGTALVSHPGVAMVSLTGAVTTGRAVAAHAARSLKKVHLELGGNCPAIVFDDADIDAAVATIRRAATANSGQVCLAAARVLVARSRYDDLLDALVPALHSVRVGAPGEGDDVEMGPMAFRGHRDRVLGHLDRIAGGRVLAAPARPGLPGENFVSPTVVTGVAQEAPVVQEEIFGPVVTVQRFDGDEQALGFANGTPFGLAASIWTRDLGRAMTLSPHLDFGTVWVNDHLAMLPEMPHGGRKDSGYGSEGSPYGIREFGQVKHVWIRHG